MDYGTHLKKQYGNQNQRSKQYTKQSKFVGSDRQIRGAILRELAGTPLSIQTIRQRLTEFSTDRTVAQLTALQEEGLIEKYGCRYQLPSGVSFQRIK